VELQPDSTIARLLAADLNIAAEQPASARACVAAAHALLSSAKEPSAPLSAYLQAYTTWLDGDLTAAGRHFEEAVALCATDIFALKRCVVAVCGRGAWRNMCRRCVDVTVLHTVSARAQLMYLLTGDTARGAAVRVPLRCASSTALVPTSALPSRAHRQ
jgi:hypothetical protein